MKPSRPPPPTRQLDRALARLAARAWRVPVDPDLPARVEAAVRERPRARVALPSTGLVLVLVLLVLGAWWVAPPSREAPGPAQAGATTTPADTPDPLEPAPEEEP